MKKPKIKIVRDRKRNVVKKSRFGNVTYPKYESNVSFQGKKINMSIHDFGLTNLNLEFDKKINLPKKGLEYGEDFISSNGDFIIINYVNKRRKKIITSIEIIKPGGKR